MTLRSAQFAGSPFELGCSRLEFLVDGETSHCKCQKRYTVPLKSTYKISQTNWYLCKCTKDYPGGYFRISISVGTKKGSRHLGIMKKFKGMHQLCSAGNSVPFIHKYEWMCMRYQRYHRFSSWLMTTNTASRSWKKHLARVGQHKLLIRSNELCLWVVMHTCASDILNWTIAYSEEYILTGVKWSDCTVISHRYVKLFHCHNCRRGYCIDWGTAFVNGIS